MNYENINTAYQLIVDLYECDFDIINNVDNIKNIVHLACKKINTEIVEECYHKFSPIGISAMAIITTSHFSIHTWPENNYAAIDIFSCNEDISEDIGKYLGELLHAKNIYTRKIERKIKNERRDFNVLMW